jgi:formylmethanofuran dehydrogenase subunit E
MSENQDFDKLLQKAADLRGHFCMGLPLGLKMAQLGLKLLNMNNKEQKEYLIVYVETDKCQADAIQVATGCSAGSRKLKMMYYGKSAATFVDSRTGIGYRVVEKKDLTARATAQAVKDGILSAGEKLDSRPKLERAVLMNAFVKLAPDELFDSQQVKVALEPQLLVRHHARSFCSNCGEEIMSGMAVVQGDKILCRACLNGAYYQNV